jgi:hypothetical protein
MLLRYSVKIMNEYVEERDATVSKISKWMHWSNNTDFKLMVIKHT